MQKAGAVAASGDIFDHTAASKATTASEDLI
jgi:hypothetical protein